MTKQPNRMPDFVREGSLKSTLRDLRQIEGRSEQIDCYLHLRVGYLKARHSKKSGNEVIHPEDFYVGRFAC